MKQRKKRVSALAALFLIPLLVLTSCGGKETQNILMPYDDTNALAAAVDFPLVTFAPQGYTFDSCETVYGIVAETTYTNDEKRLVLRQVSIDYSVSNLSGFPETVTDSVYTVNCTGDELEILRHNETVTAEWTKTVDDTECRFSLAAWDTPVSDFTALLEQLFAEAFSA